MKMNIIAKKILLIGFALLPCACVHYPRQNTYYPGNDAYSSGYTIMHRNYYRERPDHYDNGYRPGQAHFPNHQHHDRYNAPPHWSNDYSGHRQQHQQQERGDDHQFSHGNNRRQDDNDGSHRNNFDRRNHR